MSAQAQVDDVAAALSRVFGIALLVAGAAIAIRALVAIADTTTPLQKWHIYLLASGIIVLGWGIPLIVAYRWRQAALGSMVLATQLVAMAAYFTGATVS